MLKHVNSFTSIHCGITGISWSRFHLFPNQKTKLTDWNWRQAPESKLNLFDLAAFMTNAMKEVPKSNFYVFENPSAPNAGSTSKVSLNIQVSQMVGMATTIAAQNNTLPINEEERIEPGTINVAYLRKFLFAR